jgi:hypothetical protein
MRDVVHLTAFHTSDMVVIPEITIVSIDTPSEAELLKLAFVSEYV